MSATEFAHATISGVAAAVPSVKFINLEHDWGFPKDFVQNAVSKTGVEQRRMAPDGVCASDLGFTAAVNLIDTIGVDRAEIDALIYVSLSHDYRMPMTSGLLQSRLGLEKSVAAFDMSVGCSGFVYGLMVASSLVESGGFQRVLLINAEVASRRYSLRDRSTAFLFGDAGAATLVERTENPRPSFFDLSTDGDKGSAIMIPAGGCRNPSTKETRTERLRQDGSYRSDEQGAMNGPEVFSTVISEVPPQVESCLRRAGLEPNEVDRFIFHQASAVLNEHVRRKLNIPSAKFPSSVGRFGNTGGVSIPLTMVTQCRDVLQSRVNRVVFAGYGVGMSWGSAVVELPPLVIPSLIEI